MGKSWRNPKGIARLKNYSNIFAKSWRILATNHKHNFTLFSRSKLVVWVSHNAPLRVAEVRLNEVVGDFL